MKKKFVAIAAAATLVMAALAGCGSTSTTAESSAPAETTASEAASTEAASSEAASTEAASTEAASTEATTEEASTEAAAAEIPADLSGTVSMAGSTSMEKLANALAESFMAAYPGVTVTAEFTGSGAGIEAVTAGSVDIGNASRNLTEDEKAAGIAENIVAIDGIAVVVDTANEVAGLTSDQLASIYKGEVTNWSAVGGGDAEQNSGVVGNKGVSLDFVQRRCSDIFGMSGYALTGKSGRFRRQAEATGGNDDVLFDVFRFVGAFAVEVQAFITAVRNTAAAVEKAVFVCRQIGCAPTHFRKLSP